jgi:hypothetical protein
MERPGRKKNAHSYRLSGAFFLTTIGKTATLPNGITLASQRTVTKVAVLRAGRGNDFPTIKFLWP